MGYLNSAVKSTTWVGALRFFTRVVTLGKTAILARILTPSQFGVFGIATLVLSFVEIITETGINVFLVQEKGEINKYVDTAWIVSIIRGAVITLLIILTAPIIASFFKSPQSYSLLITASLIPFIRGFINPSVVLFQKDLRFDKEFYFRSLVFLFDAIVSIIFGLVTRNPISLVYGLIAGALLEVVLSFYIIKPVPSLYFEKEKFLLIVHRGKWITAAGIFNYLFHNFDNMVVAKVLNTYSLGLYQMIYKIAMLPITEITEVITRVSFPVYVKISDDKERLKKAFIKTLIGISVLAVPCGIIIFIFAKPIIEILLGPQWIAGAEILKILIVFSVVRAIFGSASALFLSVKKQESVTIVTFISFITLFITVIPLIIRYGLEGAAFSVLIASVVSAFFFIFYSIKVFRN